MGPLRQRLFVIFLFLLVPYILVSFLQLWEEFKYKRTHSLPLCMSALLTASCVLFLKHCSIQRGIFYVIFPLGYSFYPSLIRLLRTQFSQYRKKNLVFFQWPLGLNVNIEGRCFAVRAWHWSSRLSHKGANCGMETTHVYCKMGPIQSYHTCVKRPKDSCRW